MRLQNTFDFKCYITIQVKEKKRVLFCFDIKNRRKYYIA